MLYHLLYSLPCCTSRPCLFFLSPYLRLSFPLFLTYVNSPIVSNATCPIHSALAYARSCSCSCSLSSFSQPPACVLVLILLLYVLKLSVVSWFIISLSLLFLLCVYAVAPYRPRLLTHVNAVAPCFNCILSRLCDQRASFLFATIYLPAAVLRSLTLFIRYHRVGR